MNREHPHPSPYYRRHPLLLAMALLLIGLGSWIALFLVRFDLNDYREQLQVSLSDYLEMPVRLGTAHLRLQDVGIAVSFADLHLGSPLSDFEIKAPEFWVLLEWRGLLQRQPRFSRVGLTRPDLRITQASASQVEARPEVRPRPGFDIGMLLDARIRNLTVRNGRLQIVGKHDNEPDRTLILDNITANIREIGLDSPCQIDLRGTLVQDGAPAQLNLLGSLELPRAATSWRTTGFDLQLQTTGVASETLLGYLPGPPAGFTAAGRFDLSVQCSGTPAAGLAVRTELSATELMVTPGKAYREGVPIRSLLATGVVRRQQGGVRIDELVLALDGLRLAGTTIIGSEQPSPELQVLLANSSLPVAAVKRWLPPGPADADPLRRQLAGQGTLWIDRGELHFGAADSPPGVSLVSLQGAAEGLTWDFDDGHRAELDNLQFSYAEQLWRFDRGQLQLGPLALSFEGRLATRADRPADLQLKATGQAESTELLQWLWPQGPRELAVKGPLAINLQLAGPPAQLLTDLDIGLETVELNYADILRLPADSTAGFNLNGTFNEQGLQVEHAHLRWQSLDGWLNGRLATSGSRLQARLDVPDLATARRLSPRTAELDIRGAANLELSWPGADQESAATISMTLNEVAVATGDALGDLSHINGRLRLDGNGLHSDAMRAHLGSSPLRFRARIADLARPVLDLELEADTLRADELIFFSDRSMLNNIKGRLAISSEAITLDPVDVTLDGGTRASVRGRIEIARQPKVFLDITSDFVRVDEIIGLWTNESDAAAATRHRRQQSRTGPPVEAEVTILAHARTGDLYGMAFQQAEAVIVPSHDRLVIHPLDFRVGDGFCNAQVLVEFAEDGPPLLRISGHTEDVDAYQIHNELLKRKSILRGQLRGDFYLQGRAGATFLPTSFGSFHIMIRDGVLRQMPFLSKVFSILNVSQLFALKLPDMAVEGLPFRELTGDLLLEQGVFKSEGLVVKSEAMNQTYLGRYSLLENRLDLTMAVQPLGTVDKIVSRLPIAGWLLTGEDKALVTAHFTIRGDADDPEVDAIPATSISAAALGIIRRTIGLPVKLLEKPSLLWGGD